MTYRPGLPSVSQLRQLMTAPSPPPVTPKKKITPQEVRDRDIRQRFLRVDHAGEVGADRIYAGQMAVLGQSSNISKGFATHD